MRNNEYRGLAACALLCLLFELPLLLCGDPLRVPGELIALLAAFVARKRLGERAGRAGRLLSFVLAVIAGLLIVVRLDRVVFKWLMREEPLLYDQLFLLRHLFVLSGDLWSVELGLGLLGVALALYGALRLVRLLLAQVARLAEPAGGPRRRPAVWLLVAILLAASLPDGPVRFVTPALWRNLQRSARVYRAVNRRIERSPYDSYSELRLRDKPNIYLFFVESYGRVLAEHEATAPAWRARMAGSARRLGEAGWSIASAFSEAPVSGGRSWIAEASVLTGLRVRYEAVFRHLARDTDRLPNLVGFLDRQGYRTVLLAPADRPRRGLKDVNYYGYDRCVRYADLGYSGPSVGWGIVPDQYSLFHTEQHVLARLRSPLFLNFHMVSSHAPWSEVPRLVADYRELSDQDAAPAVPGGDRLLTPLKRYRRTGNRYQWMGVERPELLRRYLDAVLYSLAVVERFVLGLDEDALVVVLGDHQPPLIASSTRGFDVPVHVLAREPDRIAEFEAQGFVKGMLPSGTARFSHEGMFSLLVRSLMRCCGIGDELPQYRGRGAPLGSLN